MLSFPYVCRLIFTFVVRYIEVCEWRSGFESLKKVRSSWKIETRLYHRRRRTSALDSKNIACLRIENIFNVTFEGSSSGNSGRWLFAFWGRRMAVEWLRVSAMANERSLYETRVKGWGIRVLGFGRWSGENVGFIVFAVFRVLNAGRCVGALYGCISYA